jgi:hypothetical protein
VEEVVEGECCIDDGDEWSIIFNASVF